MADNGISAIATSAIQAVKPCRFISDCLPIRVILSGVTAPKRNRNTRFCLDFMPCLLLNWRVTNSPQSSCNDNANQGLTLIPGLDMFVKPLGGFREGGNGVRLSPPHAHH